MTQALELSNDSRATQALDAEPKAEWFAHLARGLGCATAHLSKAAVEHKLVERTGAYDRAVNEEDDPVSIGCSVELQNRFEVEAVEEAAARSGTTPGSLCATA